MSSPKVELGLGRSSTNINDYLEWVDLVERLGSDIIGFGDGQDLWNELFVTLTAAAARTRRARIGACVSNPYTRHPSVVASALATLQQFSGDRAYHGIGTGLSALRNIGIHGSTVAELEDYVKAVQTLTRGGTAVYKGEELRLSWEPRPAPVWIGARGPKMLAMAGRTADGAIVGGGVTSGDVVKQLLARIQVGTDEAGRSMDDLDIWWLTRVVVAPSEAEGIDMMRDYLAGYAAHGFLNPANRAEVPPELLPKIEVMEQHYRWHEHLAGQNHPGEVSFNAQLLEEQGSLKHWVAARFVITGPPEHCVKGLQELIEAGATKIIVPQVLAGQMESTRLIGEQVFPAFR
jgi:alkanesulfonate monooxygenase SsuD/methylene tetrahydromethanopterin reductase-like flavin-dependent oxidoreductase (luciferase family)